MTQIGLGKADYLRAASLGIEIAVAVFLGAGIGYWIDSQLKSAPWIMVLGVVIGGIAGFWNAYKMVVKDEHI